MEDWQFALAIALEKHGGFVTNPGLSLQLLLNYGFRANPRKLPGRGIPERGLPGEYGPQGYFKTLQNVQRGHSIRAVEAAEDTAAFKAVGVGEVYGEAGRRSTRHAACPPFGLAAILVL
jgi:hypothetical protein